MSSNFFINFNNGKTHTVKNIFQITLKFIVKKEKTNRNRQINLRKG